MEMDLEADSQFDGAMTILNTAVLNYQTAVIRCTAIKRKERRKSSHE